MTRSRLLSTIGPGILVAATGVGAGDLITASIAGSAFGLAVLWASVAGAVLKWFLNEGIARWQMATETTLLEGWSEHLGRWLERVFFVYFVLWSFFTGGALMSACGIAATALVPLSGDPGQSKIIWGIAHSIVGLLLVRIGGFRLFERLMAACVALMFVAVVSTAVFSRPDWASVASGMAMPRIPEGGTAWILGLLGGVGGTVTLLSYGYWIREEGRTGLEGVRTCRLDLGVGYAMTAIFGISMVIIGSSVEISGSGAGVAPLLAGRIGETMGPVGELVFLIGFWGAVFSSLLGVWQSAPYLFTDFCLLWRRLPANERRAVDYASTGYYRGWLAAIAVVPVPLLFFPLGSVQLAYAVMGALFMPMLAVTLLIMNSREQWVGREFLSRPVVNAVLVAIVVFFLAVGVIEVLGRFGIEIGT